MARRQLVPYSVRPSRVTLVALASSVAVLLGSAQGIAADPAAPSARPASVDPSSARVQSGSGGGEASASTRDPWADDQVRDHTLAPSVLASPTRLRAEPTGPTTARLTWRSPRDTDRLAGYQVFQQGTSTPIAEVPADTVTATVGSLEPGISYTFAVHAVDRYGAVTSAPAEVGLVMPARTDTSVPGSDTTRSEARPG